MRSVPDISTIAEPFDGLQICEADAGGCPDGSDLGGTSLSAPLLAGEVASLDETLGTISGM